MNILTSKSHLKFLINYDHWMLSLTRSDSKKVKSYEIYLDNFSEQERFGEFTNWRSTSSGCKQLHKYVKSIILPNYTKLYESSVWSF